jgi:excinuclease ABC subunit A
MTAPPFLPDDMVRVRGARDHNLKNVDVDLPRNALVVFSGISGSGKSTLAFGTLYAEAQRRYFESVSPYARRLIEQVGVPDVDSIQGLPPAVALQQQRGSTSTRSSVGSVTTLSNLLRMLFSRAGSYPPGQAMLYAEDFSPNTPQGACPKCHGLGYVYDVAQKSLIADERLSIRDGAIAAWPRAWQGQNLRDILVSLGYDVDTPWMQLSKKDREWILFTDEQPTVPVYAGFTAAETRRALRRKTEPSYMGTFTGVRRYVLHTFATTQSTLMKRRVSHFMSATLCSLCGGKRLKRESISVSFAGFDIAEMSHLSLSELSSLLRPIAQGHLDQAPLRVATAQPAAAGGPRHRSASRGRSTPNLSQEKRIAAQRIAQTVLERIRGLEDLGLGYLSLERATPSLSPGELQRMRLATQISSNLFGVVYVLDEPSAGLHPQDTEALLAALDKLKVGGNSLFVVEHDLEVMRRADWIIDVGPGAGSEGGEILYSGAPQGLRSVENSQTAHYLFSGATPPRRTPRPPRGWLTLKAVSRNNISGLDAAFPLGVFTVVTGVSGSGKSSLIAQALIDLVCERLGHEVAVDQEIEGTDLMPSQITQGTLSGGENIKRLISIDQKPIGRTPRSNLATYTGFFDEVRKLFAATPAAKARRYSAGRFSFNVAAGRCPTCEGEGFVSVELLFMPSVFAPCPTCHGARYNTDTLKVTYRGHSISDVLNLTVAEASEFFAEELGIWRPLKLLKDMGLGYLRLGQPATELSGGEAQRIKLATELQRVPRGAALYVIDEPSIGLHPADVDKLLLQLERLVEAGNTVVVAEHEMRIAAAADWIIDLGPGAGDQGGKVVACGVPLQIANSALSKTGRYLAPFFAEALPT